MNTLLGGTRELGYRLLVPVLIVVGYQLFATYLPSPFTPQIGSILHAFGRTWLGAGFVQNVVPSLQNLAAGYAIGVVVGVLGGALLGRVKVLNFALGPVLAFLLTIPAVAALPIFLFIFGIGQQMQTAIIAFATLGYMVLTTASAVQAIEPTLDDLARVYRFGPLRRAFQVILPAALTRIMASARVALATALLIMVVSEMIGTARGIGAITLSAQQAFDYPQMWSGMLLVSILGVGLNYLFTVLERAVARATGTPVAGEQKEE